MPADDSDNALELPTVDFGDIRYGGSFCLVHAG